MSLPTDSNLPLPYDYDIAKEPDKYLNDLVFRLQEMYEELSEVAGGSFRSYATVDGSQWVPTLNGTTSSGFTYTNQYGWSCRSGIMTEVWADVEWSATTATGDIYFELPYEVTLSSGMPFVGVCQASGIAATTGTGFVINAIPGTYRGEIWNVGSGVATGNQAVVASGRLIVYCRYIGISDG